MSENHIKLINFFILILIIGRSPSKLSMTSVNEDFDEQDDDLYSGSSTRCTSSSAIARGTRLCIPQTINEAHSADRKPYSLDLGTMIAGYLSNCKKMAFI